jgi:hypothetical protein
MELSSQSHCVVCEGVKNRTQNTIQKRHNIDIILGIKKIRDLKADKPGRVQV